MNLDRTINRCLAHTDIEREWCDKREKCKRYVAIRFDKVPRPAEFRCCRTGRDGFMPIEAEAEASC